MSTSSIVNDNATAHTSGPWKAEPIPPDAHTDPDILIDSDCAFWIAETRLAGDVLALVQVTPRAPEQVAANARLIAAAPDLLAELHALSAAAAAYMDYHAEKFYGDISVKPAGLWPAIDKARAAIAKAEGRS